MTHNNMADDLTTADAAEILGVARGTVINWCRKGGFGYKLGFRHWRIPRRCIEEILASRAKAAAPFAAIAAPQP